jgi:excisionase family DNA binding protein
MTAPAPLLDKAAVADRLGCSPRLVDKMTAGRVLPFVKVGRLTRFRPEDVERWIQANTAPAVRGPLSRPG